MKILCLIISLILFLGCTKSEEKLMSVSFEIVHSNETDGIIVAYTNDPESLWTNEEWSIAIEAKMKDLSTSYSNVLLFDDVSHVPNVAVEGVHFSGPLYDKYTICGYWLFADGKKTFCYGGYDSEGTWRLCRKN